MFFIASKLFGVLLNPLILVFLFMLAACVCFRKPRVAKTCLCCALLLFMVFGAAPFSDMLGGALENTYPVLSLNDLKCRLERGLERGHPIRSEEAGKMPALQQYDAVVVLTGVVLLRISTFDRIEFNDGAERILTGMQLVQQGIARNLIIAGGSGDLLGQNPSEARLLKRFALNFGIPEEQIMIDPNSRNTHENAVNVSALMKKHDISRIILVTSAMHLPRAMGCFKKLGIEPLPYGVDYHFFSSPDYDLSVILPKWWAFRNSARVLHEYAGIVMYSLAGYL